MADGAVQFLLDRVVTLLGDEVRLQEGLRADVESIKSSLMTMRAYLKDGEGKEVCEVEKDWVTKVRDIVYDMEDVLDDFMIHERRQPHRNEVFEFVHKHAHSIKHWMPCKEIDSRIKKLKTKIHDISNSKPPRFHGAASSQPPCIITDNDAILGIEKPIDELIAWLIDEEPRLVVISVFGPGGLGKTTLLERIYHSSCVKDHFPSQAWITVQQSFNRKELLQGMLKQLHKRWSGYSSDYINNMEEQDLIEELQQFLEKRRYVLVFDDVWDTEIWKAIIRKLPDNGCGSRVVITSRKSEVAFGVQPLSRVFNLQPLTVKEAFNLFCIKAFQSNPEGQCPLYLRPLCDQFVKKCEGLPLAIVAIGEFLSDKSQTKWKDLLDGFGSELGSNSILATMANRLSLSYNDLPYHLKYCFLYLSVFPEDLPIKRTRLVRLWIAEGFVGSREGKSLEDVADEYLNELVNRNLVKVAETDFGGRTRTCRVGAIMRLIILSKCKLENFSMVLSQHNNRGWHESQDKIRRLSIHGNNWSSANMKFTCTRSLLMFNVTDSSGQTILSRFESLKVLDLEGAPINKFPIEVKVLSRLRYLSLRNTNISVLPKEVEKLRNLETLDLKQTNVSELSLTFSTLQCLRHLLVSTKKIDSVQGLKISSGIRHLTSLQKLSLIRASGSSIIGELGSLTQLRKLGITDLKEKDGRDLCMSIQEMQNLRTLNVTSVREDVFLDLRAMTHCPRLERLCLNGGLKNMPNWISSLNYVVRIVLKCSRLIYSPLKALQDLPNLMELKLVDAYNEKELIFEANRFKRLKILELDQLHQLNSVIIEGTMPSLQKLIMRSCQNMKKVPDGFIYLNNYLKELHLYDMPKEFVNKLEKDGGEDRSLLRHIPTIHSHSRQSDGTWSLRDLS